MDGAAARIARGRGPSGAAAFRARVAAARDDRLGSAMAELVETLGGLVERLA